MANKQIERRSHKKTELRMETGGRYLEGHAAVFGQRSDDLGGFYEVIRPGAFSKTIQEADIRALFNHRNDMVLGRNKAGTLELKEDATGLFAKIEPPATTWANDLKESIRRGDINQMSFGFRAIKEEWREIGADIIRELIEVQLFDVSPVTFAAYPQTDIAVRGIAHAFKSGDELLFTALSKLNRSEELTAEEMRAIREYTDSLRSRMPEPERHSEPEEPASRHSPDISILRRQLDILEIELGDRNEN